MDLGRLVVWVKGGRRRRRRPWRQRGGRRGKELEGDFGNFGYGRLAAVWGCVFILIVGGSLTIRKVGPIAHGGSTSPARRRRSRTTVRIFFNFLIKTSCALFLS